MNLSLLKKVIDTMPNVVTLILTDTTDKLRHRFCLYDVYC